MLVKRKGTQIIWHLHTFIMIKNGFHCRASSIPWLSFYCIYPLGQDGKRGEVAVERTKSGCFGARKKGTNLLEVDERWEFVHQGLKCTFQLPSQHKSRVLLHQSASIHHGQPITWIPKYVVLFSKPDIKLIAWLAREAIRLPMARSFSIIKQPRHLPIQQPQNLPLPFRYSTLYQSHCIPDFLRLQLHECTTSSEFPRFLQDVIQCNYDFVQAAGGPRRREFGS